MAKRRQYTSYEKCIFFFFHGKTFCRDLWFEVHHASYQMCMTCGLLPSCKSMKSISFLMINKFSHHVRPQAEGCRYGSLSVICRSRVCVTLCCFGDPSGSLTGYVPGLVSCSCEGFPICKQKMFAIEFQYWFNIYSIAVRLLSHLNQDPSLSTLFIGPILNPAIEQFLNQDFDVRRVLSIRPLHCERLSCCVEVVLHMSQSYNLVQIYLIITFYSASLEIQLMLYCNWIKNIH